MASMKQLLKQLESLSNPRNLEEAKVYYSLAKYYYYRYCTDAFFEHYIAFAGHIVKAYNDWDHFFNM